MSWGENVRAKGGRLVAGLTGELRVSEVDELAGERGAPHLMVSFMVHQWVRRMVLGKNLIGRGERDGLWKSGKAVFAKYVAGE